MSNIQLIKFGPLPIRILVGIVRIIHGLPKISDIAGTQDFFTKIGLPSGLAILIALLEVIGGFAILFGFHQRLMAVDEGKSGGDSSGGFTGGVNLFPLFNRR
jgi:uncharacterized membrane protein YphA (DoxX/SURF4 family)